MRNLDSSKKILVFGLPGIKEIELDYGQIEFADDNSAEHLSKYDIIIYQSGSFAYGYRKNSWGQSVLKEIPPEAIRREKEIQVALEKGRIVCIIGSDANDYLIAGVLNSNKIYYNYIENRQVCRNIAVKRSEFKSFIDNVGASRIWFAKNDIDQIIASAYESTVLAFSKQVGKGVLLFIPCLWGSNAIEYIIEHIKKLVSALVSFSAKNVLSSPNYVEEFAIADEQNIKKEIERIRTNEIVPLENRLTYYRKMKSILWLGDTALVFAVKDFFNAIGIQVEIDEIFEEDLWLVGQKEKFSIVEVKGLNKNLTRLDISKLDEHREARIVPQLSGLLIANTFMTAESLENKDIDFSPNVVQKAVNSNLLITRTLDLCRMLNVLEKSQNPSETFLNAVLGKKGWLTFRNGKIEIITK
jgi:hypothetical protein